MFSISNRERTASGISMSKGMKTLIGLSIAHALLECFSGVWPVYKHLVGLDLQAAGYIAAATGFLAAALQPAFGHWADQGWSRAMVIWGTALTFLLTLLGPAGAFLTPFGPAVLYGGLSALMLLSRLGHSMFHPAGACMASQALAGRQASGLGIFVALGWAGYGLSQLTFSLAYLEADGHTELLAFPGLAFMVWIVAWCGAGHAVSRQAAGASLSEKIRGVWALRREVGVLFAILCLISACNIALFFLLPEMMEGKGYAPWIVHGGAQFLVMCGTALGVIMGGYCADRFGIRRTLVVCLALSFIAYQGFVLLPRLPVPLFMPCCVLAGFFLGAGQPLPVSMGQTLVPEHASLISGVMLGWTWTFGSLSQPLVAALSERPEMGITGALSAVGSFNFLAFLLALAVRDPGRRREIATGAVASHAVPATGE